MKVLPNRLLLKVEKPGRYVGGELHAIRKEHNSIKAKMVLVYPDLYDVGMSYYGFQILYHLVNREADLLAERAYAPWQDYADILRKNGAYLTSLETQTPLKEFDVVGFTLPYELTYTNILEILDLGGINIWAGERTDSEPIVIGGGAGAYNPEPLADFFDLFVVGDGEDIIAPLLRFIGEHRSKGYKRIEILKAVVENFEGVYAPAFYNPDDYFLPKASKNFAPELIKALKVNELKTDYYPFKPLVPLISITQDRLVVEIMRGCTEGCRFCQAGMLYRPVRERKMSEICRQIKESLPQTGYDEVGLLSLSTSDYTAIKPLLEYLSGELAKEKISLSYPSLRVDSFSEMVAQAGQATRKSGLTFAPEAGSERLRRVINKRITHQQVLQATELAVKYGWQLLKLYFMIGLPTETDNDLVSITELCKEILRVGGNKLSLNVTLATFIPKPFTPFQWEEMIGETEIQRRLDFLKPQLRQLKKIKVMARDPFSSLIEAAYSRGDRRLSKVLYIAWQKGARLDAWREHFSPEIWREAFKSQALDIHEFLIGKDLEQSLPWDFIDLGVSKNYLKKERVRAYQEQTTPDCRVKCLGCGVCKSDLEMRFSEPEIELPPILKKADIVSNRFRYLLHIKKEGVAIYTSHLDFMRVISLALRRAQLKPQFTQGFNPHPRISVSYPLPLGYASEDELVEIILEEKCDNLKEKLNSVLPEGIRVWKIELLPENSPSIGKRIRFFEYKIEFPEANATYLEKIANFLKGLNDQPASELPSQGKRIKELVERFYFDNNCFYLRVLVNSGRTIRPDELLRLVGMGDVNYSVTRIRTGLGDLSWKS